MLLESYIKDEEAVGTVEILLILVVLIALVIIFRRQLIRLTNNIFDSINNSAEEIYGN